MWTELMKPPSPKLPRGADLPHRRFLPVNDADSRSLARPASTGLYPDEPESCRRSWREFTQILLHLGLLLAVFKVWRIEGRAFQLLITIALATLPLHYALPYRWKQPCFLGISLLGLFCVFGPAVSFCVLAVGTVLLGVCYLPLVWPVRAALMAGMGLGLTGARSFAAELPVPDTIWPILGSMFMFRMILFLYELKHASTPEPVGRAWSYFFLLPNFCFLHFPVVDYRTLWRGYFASDIHAIQRRGLMMLTRGTLHLLLYRLIDHKLLIASSEVHSLTSLAGFIICNYLLYLRVSGQFHVACGMLHLYGFELPETHHHYLLATGFTDYWRRINIYWKDFMVKVVFNPVVFRLRRGSQPLALAVGTIAVFFTTWVLHAYQKYWLQGRFGFSLPDALFWGILGVLVLVNVQRDARRVRRKPERLSLSGQLVRTLKVAGTFTTIALLWSLWSSPTWNDWLAMLQRAFSGRA